MPSKNDTKLYPTLYGTASGGKTKVYNIHVENLDSKGALIIMEHGFEGGKMSVQKREITEGKNVGKKNETTPFDQACSDAQSKWNKKKDEGYTETKKAQKTQKLLLPMLALKYEERKHNIKFPCYVQPKLDGVRCIYTDSTYNSRQGKKFTTLDQFTEECSILEDGVGAPPDGEVYAHNDDAFMAAAMTEAKEEAKEKDSEDGKISSFQSIIAAVKKKRESTKFLKYHIYDLVDENKTFEERNKLLKDFFAKMEKPQYLVLVPTYECKNEADIVKYHNQFVQEGYEGVIIRNKDGKYTLKHRSKDLQKWKYFKDEEFEIVGGKEATGEDAGTCVFKCITKEGKEFDVRPRGTRKQRQDYLTNLDSLLHKKLTVKFQEFSDDKIPRFPVGISIRDYE